MPASDPLTTSGSPEFTRLHITPLDAELFKIIVPASAAPNVRNISYHTIETFPEKRYGFVDLPVADAEKLRQKLNGAVLKGAKMRIEKARPKTTMDSTEAVPKKEKKDKKKSKDKEGSKKRKRDPNVDDGVELSDRKVKRGWTETSDELVKRKKKDRSEKSEKSSKSKDKDEDKKSKEKGEKKRTKTKYTEGTECLLKTQVPRNKDIPDKDKADKKRRKRGNEREITVHEFEKTTRFPSFLKDSGSKTSRAEAEYVEGKGWVEEDGNVVEAVVEKRPKPGRKEKKKRTMRTPTPEPESDSETSSSGSSSEDEPDVKAKPAKVVQSEPKAAVADVDDSDKSSNGTSSDDELEVKKQTIKSVKQEVKAVAENDSDSDTSSEGSSDEDDTPRPTEHTTPISKTGKARADSSSSSRSSLKIKIPPPDTPSDGKVHPLEALYKRKKPDETDTEAPAKESFSFFSGGADDNDDNIEESNEQDGEAPVMPMTPFTKQDYEWRHTRSAAPTPDTAHPARMQNFWSSQNDEDDEMDDVVEEEEEDDGDEAQGPAGGDRATGDFQNWFWENRKDLIQSWMKRRKTAAKEKRHRENKSRASKAV